MTPGELEDLYAGAVDRERITRFGFAMVTSVIMKTMGGVSVSPEELIGEPAPRSQIDGMTASPEQKFMEHLERMARQEERQHAEWLAGLGLAASSSE